MDALANIPPQLCVQCKGGRALCGISPCPLLQRLKSVVPRMEAVGKHLWGSSPPTMFVGRHGYPNVSVGPMLPPRHLDDETATRLDHPGAWIDELSIPDVVGLRSSLVRTAHKARVADARAPDRITSVAQELSVAARPVDTEVHLSRAPRFDLQHVTDFTAPHGPTAIVEKAVLGENVRVDNAVERATSDTDLRASTALSEMYQAGVDPYQMERILSAGMVGTEARRKLVPTRWAITATDDTLGKQLIEDVKDLPTIDKPEVRFATRYGNRFTMLLLPRTWGFENIEVWTGGSLWTVGREHAMPDLVAAVDWEDHRGRTEYAHNTAGGYYATRLPILQELKAMGRQAFVVALREITDEYTTPLGVWVVRETARRAMQSKGLPFEDAPSAIRHVTRHAIHKNWLRDAQLLGRLLRQKTLGDFGQR